jgi:thiamine kinase-like enzyme
MGKNIKDQDQLKKTVAAFHTAPLIKLNDLGEGLVHKSYLATFSDNVMLVIQQFNNHVFKNPFIVTQNLKLIVETLNGADNYPLQIAQPVKTDAGEFLLQEKDQYWRAFHFIKDSHEKTMVSKPDDVFMVGLAYGQFSRALSKLTPDRIIDTIPGFHDPVSRLHNYQIALQNASQALKENSLDEIEMIKALLPVMEKMKHIDLPRKVTHNDAKLSNILFDGDGHPLAIIDLDTVMAGYALFDFGDMVRSLANNLAEDDPNIAQVKFQKPFYDALYEGFVKGGGDSLSSAEIEHLPLGAKYIILEQAIRFLTDYLEGSHYYKITYAEHNLIRTRNQLALLIDMEAQLN